ncbi:MAG: FG-GAP repeat domain-containing protein [Candidatus Midichloria sp.]
MLYFTLFYSVSSAPVWIEIEDINGDGKLDIINTNANSNSISKLLGNGDGTFQSAIFLQC